MTTLPHRSERAPYFTIPFGSPDQRDSTEIRPLTVSLPAQRARKYTYLTQQGLDVASVDRDAILGAVHRETDRRATMSHCNASQTYAVTSLVGAERSVFNLRPPAGPAEDLRPLNGFIAYLPITRNKGLVLASYQIGRLHPNPSSQASSIKTRQSGCACENRESMGASTCTSSALSNDSQYEWAMRFSSASNLSSLLTTATSNKIAYSIRRTPHALDLFKPGAKRTNLKAILPDTPEIVAIKSLGLSLYVA
ncbi:hypothetical protein SODALDRAFT_354502 [Sodiomyces alkalinus F11]|uniref:Uncharacterized protein n=1 Tax=Sodiomyces alkalinus (strain CBS 110278 / VKM F-3762 / F11) TaxID=1314773 RepID=A0A3N2Q6H2_SODAK|nr:hypothetical protein SODALDRAFT_354502 [Sodiomyces alkalinus F11]ROT42364.1 hypothetical protein SODALDRAFT_354502 [Sodiomyces alkalinus F11]